MVIDVIILNVLIYPHEHSREARIWGYWMKIQKSLLPLRGTTMQGLLKKKKISQWITTSKNEKLVKIKNVYVYFMLLVSL